MTRADELRRRRAAGDVEILAARADPAALAGRIERDLPTSPPGMRAPSDDAYSLAGRLALSAAQEVILHLETCPGHRERSVLGSDEGDRAVFYELPEEPPDVRPRTILPLTVAFCPDLPMRLGRQLLGEISPMLNPERLRLRAQLSMALITERQLWVEVARAERVPYPIVHDALRLLRRAEAKPGNASLCARCGGDLYTSARGTLPIRCALCAKESPAAREWPAHAVMPHTRGEWWLRCQTVDCSLAFVGRRQARRCPVHQLSSVTHSRRAGLRRLSPPPNGRRHGG